MPILSKKRPIVIKIAGVVNGEFIGRIEGRIKPLR